MQFDTPQERQLIEQLIDYNWADELKSFEAQLDLDEDIDNFHTAIENDDDELMQTFFASYPNHVFEVLWNLNRIINK